MDFLTLARNSVSPAGSGSSSSSIERVSRQVGEEEAAIFRAHRLLLRDPTLSTRVKSAILERKIDAAAALPD